MERSNYDLFGKMRGLKINELELFHGLESNKRRLELARLVLKAKMTNIINCNCVRIVFTNQFD